MSCHSAHPLVVSTSNRCGFRHTSFSAPPSACFTYRQEPVSEARRRGVVEKKGKPKIVPIGMTRGGAEWLGKGRRPPDGSSSNYVLKTMYIHYIHTLYTHTLYILFSSGGGGVPDLHGEGPRPPCRRG